MPSKLVIGIIICVIVVGLALGLGLGFGLKDDKGSAAAPAATSNTTPSSTTTPAAGSTAPPATGSTAPPAAPPATTTPAAAARTGAGTTSQSFGGGGGGDYTMNCPSGKIVKNISGRGGWWVDQLNGKCDDGTPLTPVGGQGGGPVNTTDCPTGYTGVDVTYGQYVGKLTPKCAGAPISTPIGSGLGSGSGQSGSFNCPSGQVITGISGKAGGFVDSMKVTCK